MFAARIFAFAVPLAPSEPGLTDEQLKDRRAAAWRLIRSLMPSAGNLSGSLLVDRIEGHDGRLWLACDLLESRQRSLLDAADPSIRQMAGTAMKRLRQEVDRMQRELRDSVIRFGEVAHIASATSVSGDPIEDVLTDQDQLLLKVMTSGLRRVEVSVTGDLIQYQLPSLQGYKSGGAPLDISVRVESVTRDSAEVLVRDGIPESALRQRGKRAIRLLRTSQPATRCPHWPPISVACGNRAILEMTVREARLIGRETLNHLELVSVRNADEIMEGAGYTRIGP